MNVMYFTNSDRNKVIYELWEKNLTIEQISSSTNIPRSTVGYYVRKFNRLAAQGKPVVFPGISQGTREQDSFAEDARPVTLSLLQMKIEDRAMKGDWEGLYYRLNVLKLLKELGFLEGEHRDTMLMFLQTNL
jgi:hypothetical protein